MEIILYEGHWWVLCDKWLNKLYNCQLEVCILMSKSFILYLVCLCITSCIEMQQKKKTKIIFTTSDL